MHGSIFIETCKSVTKKSLVNVKKELENKTMTVKRGDTRSPKDT